MFLMLYEKHLERAEKILNMLGAMSSTAVDAELTPAERAEANLASLGEIQSATAQLREAFEGSNPKAREEVRQQLAAFRASLKENIATIQSQGATSLAEWCMIDDAVPSDGVADAISAPDTAMIIDSASTNEDSAKPRTVAAPELVAVGGMML